jgi:hypothetical protein
VPTLSAGLVWAWPDVEKWVKATRYDSPVIPEPVAEWIRRFSVSFPGLQEAEDRPYSYKVLEGPGALAAFDRSIAIDRAALDWIQTNPCPDEEFCQHFAANVSAYIELTELIRSSSDSDFNEGDAQVRSTELVGIMEFHAAAIDRLYEDE